MMMETFELLLPIFVYFGIGVLLKNLFLAEKMHGYFLLRLVFNISLPVLVISSFAGVSLLPKFILPFAGIAVSFACMLMALLVIRVVGIDRKMAGTMLVNTMVFNGMFVLPFILLVYGNEGFVDAMLFNVGNILFMSSYVYILACKYAGETAGRWSFLTNIIKTPLIWAVFLACIMSVKGIVLTPQLESIAEPLGQLTTPLIMIAMGMLVSINFSPLKLPLLSIFVRMLMGVLFGVAVSAYLGLEGNTFIVVSLCAAAPVGINVMNHLSMAGLDEGLSDRVVSLSIIFGMIFLPLLIVFFGYV